MTSTARDKHINKYVRLSYRIESRAFIVEMEGLVSNAPNAVISIRYRLANYLCNE